MEQPTWAGVRAIVLAITALLLMPLQPQAERNWEFSVGAFGGKAFHSNEDVKVNFGEGSGYTTGTAHGVNLNDSSTFGAKVTAWHLSRRYNWQPQIGLELDYTKFTADLHPQIAGASGTSLTPGFELGSWIVTSPQDFSVNILASCGESANSLSDLGDTRDAAGTVVSLHWCRCRCRTGSLI